MFQRSSAAAWCAELLQRCRRYCSVDYSAAYELPRPAKYCRGEAAPGGRRQASLPGRLSCPDRQL